MWLLAVLACRHPAPAAPADEEPIEGARTWYLTARVAEERGDLATAERAWTWLVRVDPRAPVAWAGLGGALERLDRPAEALRAWENAGVLGHPDARTGRARALIALGRPGEAVDVLLGAEAGWAGIAEAGCRLATTAAWIAAWPPAFAAAPRRGACPVLPSGPEGAL